MAKVRTPYQGVFNIVRFNWHYYILSILVLVLVLSFQKHLIPDNLFLANIFWLAIILPITISLLISYYVYDYSNWLDFKWLERLKIGKNQTILNVNAGFDETSEILRKKFSHAEFIIFDFYDPAKHTEVSIKRARKAYPLASNAIQVKTDQLPLQNGYVDTIFVLFSAHEIRDKAERITFFKELSRILNDKGEIIVLEHLRDWANFLAFNMGFFHFYTKKSWQNIIHSAGLKIEQEIKFTPFVSAFKIVKNGNTP